MATKNDLDFDIKEQNRLVISIAILATAVSLLVMEKPNSEIVGFARGLLIMPGIGSFLYLIMTGSYLKYDRHGEIGEFITPVKFRKGIFDWTINIFWILTYQFILFSVWNTASSNNIPKPWDFIVGLSLSVVIASIFLVIGLIYYNKESQAQKAKKGNKK